MDLRDEANFTKIMLIGDQGVGKQSLLKRYICNRSPSGPKFRGSNPYVLATKVFPLSSAPVLANGQRIRPSQNLSEIVTKLWEKENAPETIEIGYSFYKVDILDLSVPITTRITVGTLISSSVIVICYDCSRPETLYNAIHKWHPKILHHRPNAPIFLLGCKSDLKPKSPNQSLTPYVTTEDAKKAACQIGAIDALEFSAYDEESTRKVGYLLVWYSYHSHFGVLGGTLTLWERLRALLR
ncbi:P-loop containing nucleoside triphosphate hydrolase protein [Serendipita vermifera]|nr:P-loop containing nucleoside triphosphate hydrolase protein [Serendipita vermifera]